MHVILFKGHVPGWNKRLLQRRGPSHYATPGMVLSNRVGIVALRLFPALFKLLKYWIIISHDVTFLLRSEVFSVGCLAWVAPKKEGHLPP